MKPKFLLSIFFLILLSLYSSESPGQTLDNTPLSICSSTPGCLQNPICTLTDESFKFDYFGSRDLGNGKSVLKFRITNYSEQIFKLATFELPGNGTSTSSSVKPNSTFQNSYNHSIINPYNDSLIAFEARNADIFNYGRSEVYYYIVNTADLNSPAGRKTVVTAKAGRNWKLQHIGSVQFNLDACEPPVKLGNFSGTTTPEGIALSWKISSKTNNNHFEIERSRDGRNFTKIGSVNGAENPNSLEFGFLDKNNLSGANFYRLNQLNFNGTNSHSSIIKVQTNFSNASLEVKLLPNPCLDKNCSVQILNANSDTPLLLEMRDLTGKLVFSSELPASRSNFELPKTDTGKGIYILTARNGTMIAHQKVILK